jgi:hypothetical protein
MYGQNVIENPENIIDENDLLCLFGRPMEWVDEEELELVATIARRIWLRRNFVVYGGELMHASQLVKSAKDLVEEFHQATWTSENNMKEKKYKREAKIDGINHLLEWLKWIGMQHYTNWKRIWMWFIAKDYKGDILAIMCNVMHFIIDLTVAETVIAWKEVEFCRDLGIQWVIV